MPRQRSRTYTSSSPSARMAESDVGNTAFETPSVTHQEPAAAYIPTRISPPPSPLPVYDEYKEQRLYNYVMSTSTYNSNASAPAPARNMSVSSTASGCRSHSRGNSISSIPENGNFFASLFKGDASTPSTPSTATPPQRMTRSQSQTSLPGSGPARRISNFFGLGAAASSNSSNSGLAFSTGTPSSYKRSVSNSTTLSNIVTSDFPTIQDEFSEVDFKILLDAHVPISPLSCTPQGFHALQDKSLGMIDKLYSSYLERTRALADALAEIEALRDDLEQKDQKIESLRVSVDQLANVQETLSKAAEEAEQSATRTTQELQKVKDERDKLQWEVNNPITPQPKKFNLRQASSGHMHTRTKSDNSDSGFESDTDSGSVFSMSTSSTPDSKSVVVFPQSAVSTPSTEQVYEEDPMSFPLPTITKTSPPRYESDNLSVASTTTGGGPLQQLRNALKRSTTYDSRCDCSGTINRLRSENGHLVVRVKELEGCLDSCLDLVGGI